MILLDNDIHTERIRKRYERVSRIYDFLEKPMENMAMGEWRREMVKELQGKVLEIGIGTGKNIEYYPDSLDITAIDFSQRMIDKASLKVEKLNKDVKLLVMDAQNMEFEDNTFDTVFTTCVFCSVPDPVLGLKEIKRVCKREGKIILLEHVKSEQKVIGVLMDLFNPLVVNLYGANINRNTVKNVEKAGFINIKVENIWKDIVKRIIIYNE